MQTLTCAVVNDGSIIHTKVEKTKTVHALKETIKHMKMYDFRADDLKLFMATTDKGEWMQTSDANIKNLKHNRSHELVQSLLSKQEMQPWMPLTAYDFECVDAKQPSVLHVLVVVPSGRWDDHRLSKKTKTSVAQLAPFVEFTLETSSVIVPTDVAEGTLQCTKALSTAFHDFGCFPEAIFVRKEMQMVWTILRDNYSGTNPCDVHYVLVGSPGVGKSALLLLFCCYLATHHGYWIFFSPSPKGEGGSIAPHVVIWFRGATVTGYPICVPDSISALFADFYAEKMDNKFLIVGDGFHEEELTGPMSLFSSCHLLSTSAQFLPRSGDKRELLLLPAWQQVQLDALATAVKIEDVDLRYAYSGGSLREFSLDLPKLKEKMAGVLMQLQQGILSNSVLTLIRRLFAADVADKDAYLMRSTWQPVLDSSYTLQCLAREFDLSSVKLILRIANEFPSRSLQGFELLVHKLAHDKSLELDVRDSQDNFDKCSHVKIAADTFVTVGNGDDGFLALSATQKWAVCLAFLREHATHKMYWHPGYLEFPALDSVLVLDGVVYYLQMTVADDHDVKWDQMREIHEAVCANPAMSNHTFKYVAVTPRKTSWESHKKKTSEIPGMFMCLAHLTNAQIEM